MGTLGGPAMLCKLLKTCLAVAAVCLLSGRSDGQKYERNSYLGATPPELVSEKEHWIGADEPLTLATLKGKVVWLHFNF